MKPKRPKGIPQKVRDEVSERSGGRCEIRLPGCLGRAHEKHHVKLRSRGGSHSAKNMRDACKHCHDQISENRPGTERFRTHTWQEEGETEADA